MSNPAPDLTTLSDAELADHLLAAEADKVAADLAAKKLKNEILNRKSNEVKLAYGNKPEPYGIVNLSFGGKIAKIDTPKKVEWLQEELEKLWNQIVADKADPREYIKCEYSVSETLFKSWGNNIKAHFLPARIVKTGNPSIKIVDKE